MTDTATAKAMKHQPYELFILGLSVFSVVNLSVALFASDPEVVSIVEIVDAMLCGIFLIDFAYRVVSAPD